MQSRNTSPIYFCQLYTPIGSNRNCLKIWHGLIHWFIIIIIPICKWPFEGISTPKWVDNSWKSGNYGPNIIYKFMERLVYLFGGGYIPVQSIFDTQKIPQSRHPRIAVLRGEPPRHMGIAAKVSPQGFVGGSFHLPSGHQTWVCWKMDDFPINNASIYKFRSFKLKNANEKYWISQPATSDYWRVQHLITEHGDV